MINYKKVNWTTQFTYWYLILLCWRSCSWSCICVYIKLACWRLRDTFIACRCDPNIYVHLHHQSWYFEFSLLYLHCFSFLCELNPFSSISICWQCSVVVSYAHAQLRWSSYQLSTWLILPFNQSSIPLDIYIYMKCKHMTCPKWRKYWIGLRRWSSISSNRNPHQRLWHTTVSAPFAPCCITETIDKFTRKRLLR